MKHNFLFPTIVGQVNDLEFTNKVLPIAKDVLSNTGIFLPWNYKTTYSYSKNEISEHLLSFSFIEKRIMSLCRSFLENLGYSPTIDANLYLFVSEINKNDSHPFHNHPNSILSGVCYLEVPSDSSPLLFSDPREVRQFLGVEVSKENEYNTPYSIIHPKNGDLLIWESWIKHGVPHSKSNDKRLTLVFNYSKF